MSSERTGSAYACLLLAHPTPQFSDLREGWRWAAGTLCVVGSYHFSLRAPSEACVDRAAVCRPVLWRELQQRFWRRACRRRSVILPTGRDHPSGSTRSRLPRRPSLTRCAVPRCPPPSPRTCAARPAPASSAQAAPGWPATAATASTSHGTDTSTSPPAGRDPSTGDTAAMVAARGTFLSRGHRAARRGLLRGSSSRSSTIRARPAWWPTWPPGPATTCPASLRASRTGTAWAWTCRSRRCAAPRDRIRGRRPWVRTSGSPFPSPPARRPWR